MSVLKALSLPVEIAEIGSAQLTKRMDAAADERAALAETLGLTEIRTLTAEVALHRDIRGIIHLDGQLHADIVQQCVVSLDPVEQTIVEPMRLRLAVSGSKAAEIAAAVDIDPVGDDDPAEIITGPTIDIGAIVVEHLVLAIDPYPRAPDAVLPENPARNNRDSRDSPFAALAGLARSDREEP